MNFGPRSSVTYCRTHDAVFRRDDQHCEGCESAARRSLTATRRRSLTAQQKIAAWVMVGIVALVAYGIAIHLTLRSETPTAHVATPAELGDIAKQAVAIYGSQQGWEVSRERVARINYPSPDTAAVSVQFLNGGVTSNIVVKLHRSAWSVLGLY